MPTEVWFRNPDNYIKEVAEVGALRIAWDRGYLVKRGVDPLTFLELWLGKQQEWRTALVGTQGTSIYHCGDKLEAPRAVYPTWAYGEDAGMLEEIVESPVGKDPTCYNDLSCEVEFRPVKDQPHIVVITDLPDARSGVGRQFLSYLKVLAEDNPECTFWIHGLYSYRAMFGMGWKIADVDPRTSAQKGRVYLGSGREVLHEATVKNAKWVTPLGFLPNDLKVPRNRCMFNMKSAMWAGENWEKLFAFPVHNRGQEIDVTSSDDDHQQPETKSPFTNTVMKPKEGDQVVCNTCSLQDKCKYYRDGAVCTVPGAEPRRLAEMFKSRDADQIIDGLSTLVAAGANRVERGMRAEEAFGDLDPAVSKAMNALFTQGVQLAKLIDPALRGGPGVQVNVNGGQTAIVAGADPRKLVATVVRELERQGIPRDQQTPEMIQGVIEGMRDPSNMQRAIEAPPIQGTVLDESA